MENPNKITTTFKIVDDEFIKINVEYEENLKDDNYINIHQTIYRPDPKVFTCPDFQSVRIEVKHFKKISNLLYSILET